MTSIRLKSVVFVSHTPVGSVVRGGGEPFLIRDERYAPLVAMVTSLMDGTRSRADIVAKSGPAGPFVTKLLEQLLERGLATERARPASATWRDFARRQGQLAALLEDTTVLPEHALDQWIGSTLHLAGAGRLPGMLRQSLIACGARLAGDDAPTNADTGDLGADWAHITATRLDRGGDICVCGSISGHLLVANSGAGLSNCIVRLSQLPAVTVPDLPVSDMRLSLAAAIAAFECFKRVTGATGSLEPNEVCTVDPIGQVSIRRLIALPETGELLETLRGPSPLVIDVDYVAAAQAQLAPFFDPEIGCLAVTGGRLPQIPLALECIEVRVGDRRRLIHGWGLSPGEAWLRATARALAALVSQQLPVVKAAFSHWDAARFADQVAHRRGIFASATTIPWQSADDPEAAETHLLLRLVTMLTTDQVSIDVKHDPETGLKRADVHLAGVLAFHSIGLVRADAVRDALGEAVMSLQLQRAGFSHDMEPTWSGDIGCPRRVLMTGIAPYFQIGAYI